MDVDKRVVWRRRRRGETRQAIHSIVRLHLSTRNGLSFWLGTALFGIGVCWGAVNFTGRETGVQVCLFPRINRKEGEDLYLLKLDFKYSVSESLQCSGCGSGCESTVQTSVFYRDGVYRYFCTPCAEVQYAKQRGL